MYLRLSRFNISRAAAILVTSFFIALHTLRRTLTRSRSPQLGLVSLFQSFRLHSLAFRCRRFNIQEHGIDLAVCLFQHSERGAISTKPVLPGLRRHHSYTT
ncbi:hypothetical protein F5Y08DRAFT_14149 [Xylaria arbuscula]|nr:hypothetical protein F5Y08DRAFT_14149 [Xylaria arbuscula]